MWSPRAASATDSRRAALAPARERSRPLRERRAGRAPAAAASPGSTGVSDLRRGRPPRASGRRLGQPLEVHAAEDLQHVDQVDARGGDDQRERGDEDRPADVQAAVAVGVVDEAQRDGEAGEHQRPGVEEEHRRAHAVADPRHAVVQVLLVGGVDGPAVLQALEHDERGVEERHGEQDQRQREGDDRRGLQVALDRDRAHQQAEQVRSGVAHEARRRREVVDEEAERGARGDCGEDAARVLGLVEAEGDHGEGDRDDPADPGREPVDAVGEVDDVHQGDEEDRGDRGPASGRSRRPTSGSVT